jgi:hypothetical protein
MSTHTMPIKEVIAAMEALIAMLTLLKADLKRLEEKK